MRRDPGASEPFFALLFSHKASYWISGTKMSVSRSSIIMKQPLCGSICMTGGLYQNHY